MQRSPILLHRAMYKALLLQQAFAHFFDCLPILPNCFHGNVVILPQHLQHPTRGFVHDLPILSDSLEHDVNFLPQDGPGLRERPAVVFDSDHDDIPVSPKLLRVPGRGVLYHRSILEHGGFDDGRLAPQLFVHFENGMPVLLDRCKDDSFVLPKLAFLFVVSLRREVHGVPILPDRGNEEVAVATHGSGQHRKHFPIFANHCKDNVTPHAFVI
mmetsp:Transcript_11800/g.35067  ORF Transcript_11800/g.35067 Transcript_11800/m.35067 type:complete len:213 (-) Transcript_11800:1157-1795(-)